MFGFSLGFGGVLFCGRFGGGFLSGDFPGTTSQVLEPQAFSLTIAYSFYLGINY